jgi:hypothetical protein
MRLLSSFISRTCSHTGTPVSQTPSLIVEHRDSLGRHVLATLRDHNGSRHALTPFVARLLLDGATGEVVLIDDATRTVVAHRSLAHPAVR